MSIDPKEPFEAGDYGGQLYYIDHISKKGSLITKLFFNKCNLVNITASDKFYEMLYAKKIVLKSHDKCLYGLHRDWILGAPLPRIFEECDEKENARGLVAISSGKHYRKVEYTIDKIKRLTNQQYEAFSRYFESRPESIPEIEPGYVYKGQVERKQGEPDPPKADRACPCKHEWSCAIL